MTKSRWGTENKPVICCPCLKHYQDGLEQVHPEVLHWENGQQFFIAQEKCVKWGHQEQEILLSKEQQQAWREG